MNRQELSSSEAGTDMPRRDAIDTAGFSHWLRTAVFVALGASCVTGLCANTAKAEQPPQQVAASANDAQKPKEKTPPLYLRNLRRARNPQRPWYVSDGDLSATVRVTDTVYNVPGKTWDLSVQLDVPDESWQIISATTSLRDTEVVSSPPSIAGIGPKTVSVRVKAPMNCPIELTHEEVLLDVKYISKGKQQSAVLPLDHRCLLGHISTADERFSARAIARLAEQYLYDPEIDRLIGMAKKAFSVEVEVAQLKKMLQFNKDSTLEDPLFRAPYGYERKDTDYYLRREGYALSPTETTRLGGDCEDWSIFLAAYFSRRGYDVQIASWSYIPNLTEHVWVTIKPRGSSSSPTGIDFRLAEPLSRLDYVHEKGRIDYALVGHPRRPTINRTHTTHSLF